MAHSMPPKSSPKLIKYILRHSPHFPRSNGHAEQAVQTVKKLQRPLHCTAVLQIDTPHMVWVFSCQTANGKTQHPKICCHTHASMGIPRCLPQTELTDERETENVLLSTTLEHYRTSGCANTSKPNHDQISNWY